MVVMVNCVTILPSLVESGTYSSAASRVITTPAAWVEACRGIPSSFRAISISSCTEGSCSYWRASSLEVFSAFCSVIFSSMGTSFATASTC